MPQRLFLTGGSGYIGSTLIAHFLAAGYSISALSRSSSSDAKLASLGATPLRGSLTTLDVLTSAARDADVVISIADAIAGDFSMSTEARFAINDAAIDALAKGLEGSGKPLVLTGGSLYAAADPEGRETDETAPTWPEGHWAAFDLGGLRQRYVDMGVRVCQVRLAPWVYGRGGSGVGLFMGMWRKAGEGMKVDGGEMCTTAVHVDDVVELYLRVAERGRAGEACKSCAKIEVRYGMGDADPTPDNATAQTDVTLGQLAEAICRAIDVPCTSLTFDQAVPKVGAFLAGFLSTQNRASNRKAREELGWEVRGQGILEEIETGSYVEVAQALKEGSNE